MHFMNEYEIEEALWRFDGDPVLGPAAQTLANLVEWTNRNSDGWPYWPKPCRAAAKLQELLERSRLASIRSLASGDIITVAEYRAALRPLKAFRTRQGADFDIVEV